MSTSEYKDTSKHDDLNNGNNQPYKVEDLGNSTFETCFHVSRSLYGKIIGAKGMTKQRIESQSKTLITIPGRRDTGNSMISIKGMSTEGVCAARRKIESLVASSQNQKPRVTHFGCVPACTDDMKKAFNRIKEEILSDGYPGIDDLLFIDDCKIHITLAVCSLFNDQDQKKAVQIFQECSQDILDSKSPMEVTISGLRKFDDEKLTKVRVLFAGVQSSSLQTFADKLLQKFKQAQLNTDKSDTVSLHMTVMNVRYRIQGGQQQPRYFDATDILKKYGNYDFGSFSVNQVHLSELGTKDENGFYKALCVVSF